jgi:hypothetical protein
MARPKRTRTTSISRTAPRGARKLRQSRRDVAAEAARIMATEGQRNYRAAKQKAANRIGISSRLALPSNLEVEDALRSYQGFYGGEQHRLHLGLLRNTALKAMRAFESFQPRLVGPVLDGTADHHSRVTLHLFNDPPEAIALHLRERGLVYREEERRIRWHDGGYRNVCLLVIETDGIPVELALFGSLDLRQAPPSPVDGKPQRRAPLSEVECLVAGA